MKRVVVLISLLLMVSLCVLSQTIGDPGSGEYEEYNNREDEWINGENGEICVRQCILFSASDCIYVKNWPTQC